MAKYNRTTLKGYFETGNIPSQAQYGDLIDSNLNLAGAANQSINSGVTFTSAVTASSNISSSGTIQGLTGSFDNISLTAVSLTNITASGDISSSGTITSNVMTPTSITNVNTTHITASGNISSSGNIFTTDIYAVGHITASGNISASGILTVANIELSPGGAIRPTINNNTIKFAAQDHGSAEFMEIGSDKFNVYMDGRATITLNRSDTEEGQIILNATNDNYDVNIKYDDTSIAFRSDAASHFTQMSGPLVITRSGSTLVTPLGSGFNTVADGNSALQLSGSQFTNGHITASGNISSSIGTGSFGSLVVDGSSVDFTNLPTSDPGIAGRLYNDSGTIKISL